MGDKKTFVVRTQADAEALGNSILGAVISKPLRVTVELYKKNRSLAQNRLNWLWCGEIRKWLFEAGVGFKNARGETIRPYSEKEIHDWNKQLFGPSTVVEINGIQAVRRSSKDMNTTDFAQFLGDIDKYWADQGLVLTHPDDIYNEAMAK